MAAKKRIVVQQTRGVAGRPPATRATLKALGLGRIGKKSQFELNPALSGMLRSVEHLIKVSEVK